MPITDELLEIAIETACEAERARDAALELRQATDSFAAEPPVGETAIRQIATAFKIPVRHRQIARITVNLTDVLLADISNPGLAPSKTARAFADERDLRDWERRGVLPHGAYHEAARAISIAQSEDDSIDDEAIALQLERCRLALAYPATLACRIARTALTGEPLSTDMSAL